MGEPLVIRRGSIGQPPRRQIEFTPDNRLNARLKSGFIKIDNAEHRTVIGNGYRIHIELRYTLEQGIDSNGAVKQTVLGVDMKMDKWSWGIGHERASFLLNYSKR